MSRQEARLNEQVQPEKKLKMNRSIDGPISRRVNKSVRQSISQSVFKYNLVLSTELIM